LFVVLALNAHLTGKSDATGLGEDEQRRIFNVLKNLFEERLFSVVLFAVTGHKLFVLDLAFHLVAHSLGLLKLQLESHSLLFEAEFALNVVKNL